MKPFKLVLPRLTEEQKKGIGRLEKQGFWRPLKHQRRGNPDGFGSEIYDIQQNHCRAPMLYVLALFWYQSVVQISETDQYISHPEEGHSTG